MTGPPAAAGAHCYECGQPCQPGRPAPVCPVHGPRWKLIRNGPCASVLVVEGDSGRVLFGRRAIEPNHGHWELPGGFVDLGEHPADAARREAREEVGLAVELVGLLGIYVDETAAGPLQTAVYVARPLGEPAADGAEVSEVGWFDPAHPPQPLVPSAPRRLRDWLGVRPVTDGAGMAGEA